jgi:hypothetical protein
MKLILRGQKHKNIFKFTFIFYFKIFPFPYLFQDVYFSLSYIAFRFVFDLLKYKHSALINRLDESSA